MKSLDAEAIRPRRRTFLGAAVPVCLALCLLPLPGCSTPPEAPGPPLPAAPVGACYDLVLHFPEARCRQGDRSGDPGAAMRTEAVGMNGTYLPAIFAHPPAEVAYRLDIPPGARLHFSIALRPEAWKQGGDGVFFEVLVRTMLVRRQIFSRNLDSASRPEDRGWQACQVDLGPYAGEDREIVLRTGPGPAGDPRFDWALWGEPQILSPGRRIPGDETSLPHVFLVSLDTLRKDRLDLFGHSRLTAPHLDRLAREALLFTRAQAQSHWTMPSHMSVFTSLTPDVHRVADVEGDVRLAPAVPTLAEILRRAGYRTAGFAAATFLKGDLGFARGFETYELRLNDAGKQGLLARDWIESHRQEKMFVFLHLFDAHSDWKRLPYEAPGGFDALFGEAEPERDFQGCAPAGKPCASVYLENLSQNRTSLKPAELAAIRTYYDRGLRYLDFRVAELAAWLKGRGLWENSLVIFFSDHGEEFQDHGLLLHSQLYEELLRVPLWVKLPGGRGAGRRVEEPAELIDLGPTVLELLGLPIPPQMQGRSLLPLIDRPPGGAGGPPAGPAAERPLLAMAYQGWSCRDGRWKLISLPGPGGKVRHELFDLETDPGERMNLFKEELNQARRLQELMADQLRRHEALAAGLGEGEAPAGGPVFSEEERKRLELLGYLQ